ncbi:peptidase U62 modulator of DNA gyrase [Sulfolobus islandicus Y.N.15.51]|jgi:PmbA protein|uniref:Peptidase U62 modulator of DNA gyrase n=1 Tax=Saccharolobus islandicus (strain Y.N.15.51 / Yellowstone \|nr:TldD/PmbA family protein [Sulfolobus islandicus]ACP48451.1 peptidase U62 modulator of DNA gyrase [Sulfolobus islandicus Y.N.15.51]
MYDKLISRAKLMGISLEIFSLKLKEYTISKEKFYIPENVEEIGYGIRVIDDKSRMGYIYMKKLDENTLEQALKISKLGEPDKANVLPQKQPINKMSDYEVNPDVIKDVMISLRELEENVNLTTISASAINYEVSIFNTEGVEVREKRGVYLVQAVASKNTPEVYEILVSKDPKIPVNKLKENLLEKIKIMENRERLEGKRDVVFTQKALNELLSTALPKLFSARSFHKGTTPFKLGEIINEGLEIIDDPLDSSLPFSRSFDDEGNPSKVVNITDKGEVRSPLTNSYWSVKLTIENTSSASRQLDSIVPSYTIPPSIGSSNIVIRHNNVESDIEDNSVVVDQLEGVNTIDYSCGDFSLIANVSWLNEKGNKTGLKEVMITGNIKQLLKNLVSSSKDVENYGKIISGKLRVSDLSIS